MAPSSDTLTKRDAMAVGAIVVLSIVAQALAALYFEAKGSLLALGGSGLAFMVWVLVRFRRRA